MKKAAKDAKEDDDKGTAKKGLTAGQKKLPEAMQKAILKKQGK
jgi:ribosomal protein S20